MKLLCRRLAMLSVLVVLATTLAGQPPADNIDPGGGGGGGGSCQTCYVRQSGNSISMMCGSPAQGEWGHQNCRIESYPEATYCFVDGNDCCVD